VQGKSLKDAERGGEAEPAQAAILMGEDMTGEKPVVEPQHALRRTMGALAKIMRMPSELRARKRAQAEEQTLDQLLDRIAAGKAADQDNGAGENQGPLTPRIDLLFGLLIGVVAVLVLIAMLALLSLRSYAT
jgi:hypothetical protein